MPVAMLLSDLPDCRMREAGSGPKQIICSGRGNELNQPWTLSSTGGRTNRSWGCRLRCGVPYGASEPPISKCERRGGLVALTSLEPVLGWRHETG